MKIVITLAVILGALGAAGAHAAGDAKKGREIAIRHCARCHVVGDYNRLGGIDSTPSFQLLARRRDFVERLQTFYQRRPHPVFVRVPGLPRWSKQPPYATPFEVTPAQIEHIIAFVATLKNWKRPARRRRR